MSATLRRKITQAVKGYLTANYASWRTVGAVTVVEGENNSEPTIPYLIVSCLHGEDHEILRGVQQVPLVLTLITGVNPGLTGTEASRANVDEQMKSLNDFILAPVDSARGFEDDNEFAGVLKAALNKPVGTDNRTVKPLHIYDLYPEADDSDPGDEIWMDSITYMVVCQPMDSS